MKVILPKSYSKPEQTEQRQASSIDEITVRTFLVEQSTATSLPQNAYITTSTGRAIPIDVNTVNSGNVVNNADVSSFTNFLRSRNAEIPTRDHYEDWLIEKVVG